jgi:hypothetical protein
MSEVIASEMPPSSRDWSQLLGSIKAEMVRPMPDTDRVVERVDEALDELDAWLIVLRSRPLDAGAVDRLMSASVDRFRSSSEPTWDRGAQLYLAVAALYAARCDLNPSRRDPAMADALGMLLERLSFPGDSNSPREYRIKELDSPLSAIRSRADTDE